MLNEEAASAPAPQQSPPSAPRSPVLPSPARALRTQMRSPRWSRPRFVYLGMAAALLCALAVFFVLFHREQPAVPKARATAGPVAVPVPVQTPASSVAEPVASPPVEAPKQQEPAPEAVQFRMKRSKSFERVGPIRLRLVKANPKRNVCDLYIASGGPSYQKQVHLNKPVQIDLSSAGSVELVVTSIRTDQINGSVQQK